MKKVIFLLILLIVAIVVLIGKGIADSKVKPSELPTAEKRTENSFTVLVDEGDVFYGDGKKFTRINDQQIELHNGTFIKTDLGKAQIILADNSVITIDQFTSIQITTETKKTTISQLYGKTWHRVRELIELGEYRVETDNTVAAVRGTVFGVVVGGDGSTEVYGVEDELEVIKGFKKPDGTWEILEKTELVHGNKAFIQPPRDTSIQKDLMEVVMIKSDWYLDNRVRDEVLEIESRQQIIDFLKRIRLTPEGIEQMYEEKEEYQNLAEANLNDTGVTPTPTPIPTPTLTPSVTHTPTQTPTPTPTPTPDVRGTSSQNPTPTPTPSPTFIFRLNQIPKIILK